MISLKRSSKFSTSASVEDKDVDLPRNFFFAQPRRLIFRYNMSNRIEKGTNKSVAGTKIDLKTRKLAHETRKNFVRRINCEIHCAHAKTQSSHINLPNVPSQTEGLTVCKPLFCSDKYMCVNEDIRTYLMCICMYTLPYICMYIRTYHDTT